MDQTGIFALADDNWIYNGVDSLLSRKVGVIRGYDYEGEVDNYIVTRKDVFKPMGGNDALTKNIRKLYAKRINTVIESVPVMRAKARELGLEGAIKLVGAFAEPQPLYIACAPDKPRSHELIELVNATTKKLRASGELEKIMQKYGLTDWK
jgi:polar amino acid transport system substrate-binding protein